MSSNSCARSGIISDVQNLQNALNSLAAALGCERVCLPISKCNQEIPVILVGATSSGKSSLMNTLLFDDCDALAPTAFAAETFTCTSLRSSDHWSIDGQTYDSSETCFPALRERLKRNPQESSKEIGEPLVVDVTMKSGDSSMCFDKANAANFLDTPGITDAENSLASIQKLILRFSDDQCSPILVCCIPACGMHPRDPQKVIDAGMRKLLLNHADSNQIIFVATGFDILAQEQKCSLKENVGRNLEKRAMADETFKVWRSNVLEMFPGSVVVRFARFGEYVEDNKHVVPDDERCAWTKELRLELAQAITRAHCTNFRQIADQAWTDLGRMDFYHRLHSRTSGVEDFVAIREDIIKRLIADALNKYDTRCSDSLFPKLKALVRRAAQEHRKEHEGKKCWTQARYRDEVMKLVSCEIDELVKGEIAKARLEAIQALHIALMQEIVKSIPQFNFPSFPISTAAAALSISVPNLQEKLGYKTGILSHVSHAGKTVGAVLGPSYFTISSMDPRLAVGMATLGWAALAVCGAATSVFTWKFEDPDTDMIRSLKYEIKKSVAQDRKAFNESLDALIGRFSTSLSAMRNQKCAYIQDLIHQIEAKCAMPKDRSCIDSSEEIKFGGESAILETCGDLAKLGLRSMASILATNANADHYPKSQNFPFRHRICFDKTAQQLDLQVEWSDPMPVVICVRPNGEADRRGILSGDSIAVLNGMETVGKTLAELLLKIKERPLVLEVDRSTHADSKHPHLEVGVKFKSIPGYFEGYEWDHAVGIDVSWKGALPVVSAVQEGSAAWYEGVYVGDAIYSVDDVSATAVRRSILSALPQGPLTLPAGATLTLWRRPVGADITAPWNKHLYSQSPAGFESPRTTDGVPLRQQFVVGA